MVQENASSNLVVHPTYSRSQIGKALHFLCKKLWALMNGADVYQDTDQTSVFESCREYYFIQTCSTVGLLHRNLTPGIVSSNLTTSAKCAHSLTGRAPVS